MTIKNIVDDLPQHSLKRYGKRYLTDIKHIAIHHTGVRGKIESFAKYHVSKGWPGIGYHFVIDNEGIVYVTNTLDTVSYNVGGYNTKVVGIAIIGDFDNEPVNLFQQKSLTELVEFLKGLLGNVDVKGHNEFKPTLCPGKNLTEFIKTLN